MKKNVKEGMDFREFMDSAYIGGSGYEWYGKGRGIPLTSYGENPQEKNDNSMNNDEKYSPGIKDMLSHINTISGAALNKYQTLDNEQKKHVYIKRQLKKAGDELTRAYIAMMNLNRTR